MGVLENYGGLFNDGRAIGPRNRQSRRILLGALNVVKPNSRIRRKGSCLKYGSVWKAVMSLCVDASSENTVAARKHSPAVDDHHSGIDRAGEGQDPANAATEERARLPVGGISTMESSAEVHAISQGRTGQGKGGGRVAWLLGVLVGASACVWGVGSVAVVLIADVWASAMAAVGPSMQWPIVMVKLGKRLPPVLRKRSPLNPACLVMLIVATLVPNGSRTELPWSPGERARQMFEAARWYNQEVWVGTRHRETITTKERGGDMTVKTTLSIVSCGRRGYQDHRFAVVESFTGGVNWFSAPDIPCGSVRMPNWLFTKKPLDKNARRRRQGLTTEQPYFGRVAAQKFESIWYSPFKDVSLLSNMDGWTPSSPPEKESVRNLNADYEWRALLTQRDGELVDAGINRIGFHWYNKFNHFDDNLARMDAQACLDDTGVASCRMGMTNDTYNMHLDFAYIPWLDRWTFNASAVASESSCQELDPKRPSDTTRQARGEASFEACVSQESESWSRTIGDLNAFMSEGKRRLGDPVDTAKYEAGLDVCPGNLVLHPGNQSFIRFGGMDKWGDQMEKLLKDKGRELQERVYERIPKDGITRTPTSTLFLTVVAGMEGIFAAASWEITLLVANFLVRLMPHWKLERKIHSVRYMSLLASFLLVTAAVMPAGFLLHEELQKTKDVRVDGEVDMDTTRRSTIEGDGFLGMILVVSTEVRDASSRHRDATVIVSVIAVLGLLVMIKRVRELIQPQGRLREAFVIVGAVEP